MPRACLGRIDAGEIHGGALTGAGAVDGCSMHLQSANARALA